MKNALALVLRILVHLICFGLLIWLYLAATNGDLGGEPVEAMIHYLGIGALRLLLLTLVISPLVKISRYGQLNKLRRPLGLWCFVWASLHFCGWLWLDLGLDWSLIGSELVKRSYIILGFICWLLLLTLAITSLPILVRALGKRWKILHAWIYPVAITACIHFWWSLKSGWIEPAIYLAIFIFLIFLRGKKALRFIPFKLPSSKLRPSRAVPSKQEF